MARNPILVDGMMVTFSYAKPGEQPTTRRGFVNANATTDKVLNICEEDSLPAPYKSFRWGQIVEGSLKIL